VRVEVSDEPTSWKIIFERMIDNAISDVSNSDLCRSKQGQKKSCIMGN
jgi:hypothetical protein